MENKMFNDILDSIINNATPDKIKVIREKLNNHLINHIYEHDIQQELSNDFDGSFCSHSDISTIAIWLGHSSILTTHKYMVADIELKRKAMEKVKNSSDSTLNYQPSKDILDFLDSL